MYLCVYVSICMFQGICMYVSTCINISMCVYICLCMHVCICIYEYSYMYIYQYMYHMYVYLYICICRYISICVYMYVYVSIFVIENSSYACPEEDGRGGRELLLENRACRGLTRWHDTLKHVTKTKRDPTAGMPPSSLQVVDDRLL
jgi:hypothetical protein